MAIAGATVLWGALAIVFDYGYDLNDDVMIKDILSGIYTGIPDAHNNQMLYPVSILIAGLYRMTDRVAWFGLIEIICMAGSFVITAGRLTSLVMKWAGGSKEADSDKGRNVTGLMAGITCMIFMIIIYAGLMLWELINVQYTVVAGMLTAAAAVWLYTGDPVGSHKENGEAVRATYTEMSLFVKKNIPAIILVTLAFNIRSELVLLLSPFLAAVAVGKWIEEERRKDAFVTCGYLAVFLSICLLMLVSLGADGIAYSSPGWKEYRRFFDARTEVYDFTGIPDYDENADFYESAGITRKQYDLLVDYDYFLDESIDADMLTTIAEGVKSGKAAGRSTYGKGVREAVWEYVHNAADISSRVMSTDIAQDHLFADEAGQHAGFNVTVIILYLALIAMGVMKTDASMLLKIPVFWILRSIPWIYVYLQGRVLSRITHPLYMLEVLILLAMLINGAGKANTNERGERLCRALIPAATCFIAIVCILLLPVRFKYVSLSTADRSEANISYEKMMERISADPDTYYYLDTYMTVDWTEKIFTDSHISKKNMQLLGGWMGNSPLDTAKKSAYGDCEVILTNND